MGLTIFARSGGAVGDGAESAAILVDVGGAEISEEDGSPFLTAVDAEISARFPHPSRPPFGTLISVDNIGSSGDRRATLTLVYGRDIVDSNDVPTLRVVATTADVADASVVVSSRAALAAEPTGGARVVVEYGIARAWRWSADDWSADVTRDIYSMLVVAPTSDTTGASGAWVGDLPNGEVYMAWAGLGGDWIATATALRQIGRMRPGITVRLEGRTYEKATTATTAVIEGVRAVGKGRGRTVIKQGGDTITNKSLIGLTSASDGVTFTDLTLDGSDLIHGAALIYGAGVHDVTLDDFECIGWDRAIHLESSETRALERPSLIDVRVTDASPTRNGYPVLIEAKLGRPEVTDVLIRRFLGRGPGIAWVDITTPGTGDFIALKNIDGYEIDRPDIDGGGEIGIAPSVFARNGLIIEPRVTGCDADGLGLGNGQVAVETDGDETTFAEGETVTFSGGASGTLSAIYNGELMITSVSLGGATALPDVGQTVTGGTSAASATITARRFGTEAVRVIGGRVTGNGIDAPLTGDPYAGAKLILTSGVVIDGTDFSDAAGVQTRGLYIVSSVDYSYSAIGTTGLATPIDETGLGLSAMVRRSLDASASLVTPRGANTPIAAGALSVPPHVSYARVVPESGTEDEITSIAGSYDGHRLLIGTHAVGRTITITGATGNLIGIKLAGDACVLSLRHHLIELIYDEALSSWIEIRRNF